MRLWAGPRHCCCPSSFLPPFGAIVSLFGIGCGVARNVLQQLQRKRHKVKSTTGSPTLWPSNFYPEQTGSVAMEKKEDMESKAWMQNNFIEFKVEKEMAHRGQEEQSQRCSGAPAGCASACLAERGRATCPSRLV